MTAFLKMTQAGLKSFLRDRSGLFWSFFFPVFFIVIFGSVFGRAGNRDQSLRFQIGLVTTGLPIDAAWIPDVFKKVPVFTVHEGALEAEKRALIRGDRRAVVVFPPDLIDHIQIGQPAEIQVYYDPAQEQTSRTVVGIVEQVLAGIDKGLSGSPTLLQVRQMPVAPDGARELNLRGIDYLLPGILAMTIMQLGLFTAIPIINMREKGILKRLRATPLPRSTLVTSQIAQRLVIGVIQTFTIIAIGMFLYRFRVSGSWLALMGVVVLGVLTFICIGAILASIARTQESGVSLVQLVNLPMMFLSGLFIPMEFIPRYLLPVSQALPATYLADALRAIMLSAPSAHSLTTDLAVIVAWLLGSLFLAARLFRWE